MYGCAAVWRAGVRAGPTRAGCAAREAMSASPTSTLQGNLSAHGQARSSSPRMVVAASSEIVVIDDS